MHTPLAVGAVAALGALAEVAALAVELHRAAHNGRRQHVAVHILQYGPLFAERQCTAELLDRRIVGHGHRWSGSGVAQQRRLVGAIEAVRLAVAHQLAGDAAATGTLERVARTLEVSAQSYGLIIAAAIATIILAVAKELALVDADARGTLQLVVPANT